MNLSMSESKDAGAGLAGLTQEELVSATQQQSNSGKRSKRKSMPVLKSPYPSVLSDASCYNSDVSDASDVSDTVDTEMRLDVEIKEMEQRGQKHWVNAFTKTIERKADKQLQWPDIEGIHFKKYQRHSSFGAFKAWVRPWFELAREKKEPNEYNKTLQTQVDVDDDQESKNAMQDEPPQIRCNESLYKLTKLHQKMQTCKDPKELFDWFECEAIKRILVVLKAYYENSRNSAQANTIDIRSAVLKELAASDLLPSSGSYGPGELSNDFLHFQSVHIDEDKRVHTRRDHDANRPSNAANPSQNIENDDEKHAEPMFESFTKTFCAFAKENGYGCHNDDAVQDCVAFTRHFRDRASAESQLLYFGGKVESVEDVIFEQECDKIHVYVHHSALQFGTERDHFDQNKQEKLIKVKQQHTKGRSFSQAKDNTSWWDSLDNHMTKEPVDDYLKDWPRSEGKATDENPEIVEMDNAYRDVVTKMGVFRFQAPYGFRAGQTRQIHYNAKYGSIKEEALQNQYAPMSAFNWSVTLKKSQIFSKSRVGRSLMTAAHGYFEDGVSEHKEEWDQGVQITVAEIVTIKTYIDFDDLQFELKRCFRFETFDDIFGKAGGGVDDEESNNYQQQKQELEQRLSAFWNWRGSLLLALNKFGAKLGTNRLKLYHGVNCKMTIKPSRAYAFSGPLSTTSSEHVAREFATQKGMVLTIKSRFPRLKICNAFDVHGISDYPEEHEWIVGFMYVSMMNVFTKNLAGNNYDPNDVMAKNSFMALCREQFCVIHLFGQQVFDMHGHLALMLAQYLRWNRYECCDTNIYKQYKTVCEEQGHWNNKHITKFLCRCTHRLGVCKDTTCTLLKLCDECKQKVFADGDSKCHAAWDHSEMEKKVKLKIILIKKFHAFQMEATTVTLNRICPTLQPFFMTRLDENDIKTGQPRWIISFEEITRVYPNATHLKFVNDYKLDQKVLKQLNDYIGSMKQEATIKKIEFLYYDYEKPEERGQPIDCDEFYDPDELKKDALYKTLNTKYRWELTHRNVGKTGYKIVCKPLKS